MVNKHTNAKSTPERVTTFRETGESKQATYLAQAFLSLLRRGTEDIETAVQLSIEPVQQSFAQLLKRLDEQRELIKGTAEKTRRRLNETMRERLDSLLAESRQQVERITQSEQAMVESKAEVLRAVAEVRAQMNERCDHLVKTLDGHTEALNEVLMRVGRVYTELEKARPQKRSWSIVPARFPSLRPGSA